MRKMRRYRDYLIEELADRDEALSFLEVLLEEHEKDPDAAALYYGFSAAVEGQGGVQKFALKTHSTPQAVSDALLSKDEIQIAELLKKQVLARSGKDKDRVQNGPLPKGWREVRLGEFMEFKNGLNTRKENYGSGVKFVNVMDVFGHNYLYANDVIGSVQVTKKQLVDYSVKYGDVLFNRTSETFEEIAMSSVYLDKKEIIFGGFVIRGRQKSNILIPEYSAYCFQAHTVRRELIRRGQGAVRANIGQKDLSKIPLVIPPVNEQKAIASLLEKWDTAIEKTETLIEAKEKRFKWLLKTLTQPTKEWQKSTMSDSFDLGRGRVISKKYIEKNKGIYPVFSSQTSNNGEFGKINTFDFEGNYITWTTDGANAGEVFFRKGKFNCTNVCGTAKPKDEKEICARFIAYYLKGKTKKYVSYVGNPKLMNGVFGTIPIRYPASVQQKAIAHVLSTAQQEIALFEKLIETYRTQKRGLMQKLLTGEWRVKEEKMSCRT